MDLPYSLINSFFIPPLIYLLLSSLQLYHYYYSSSSRQLLSNSRHALVLFMMAEGYYHFYVKLRLELQVISHFSITFEIIYSSLVLAMILQFCYSL